MIISSEIFLVSPQADGRKYIIEKHITDSGREIQVQYLADVGFDFEAKMVDRVPELEAQIAAEEGGE